MSTTLVMQSEAGQQQGSKSGGDLQLTSLGGNADVTENALESPPNAVGVEEPTPLASQVKLKIISASLSFCFAGLNDGSVGPLLPYILSDYGLSTGLVTVIYAAALAGWLLAAASDFFLSRYLGMGTILAIGAALQLLSHCLRAWKPPFALFAVTFLMAGLGTAYQDAHSNTFVSTVKGAHRWLGVIHAMYGLGLLISPFVATAIASSQTPSRWYMFYYFPLAVGVINFLLVLVAFRDSFSLRKSNSDLPDTFVQTRRSKDALQDVRATLKLPAVWLLSLFYFFYLGASLTAGGWIVEYLVTVRHGELSKMGYIPSGYTGGVFLGRLFLPEPTHRYGERRMILLYALIALALQLVFWLVPNIIASAITFSFMGFVLGPFFPTGMSVASKLFPEHAKSSALGLVFVLGQAGGALFPSLTGLVATRAGVQTLQPILTGLLVLTGITWWLVPKIPHRSE